MVLESAKGCWEWMDVQDRNCGFEGKTVDDKEEKILGVIDF